MDARTAPTMSSTPDAVAPPASARSVARWMTGPSDSGSEKGRPASSTWAPAQPSARRMPAERGKSGSPAVTYVTSPVRFSDRMRSKAAGILDANFGSFISGDLVGHALNVLIAPAGEIHENVPVAPKLLSKRARISDGVGRF